MEYGFVYIWYDRKHKRYYIGCHWGDINDGYICSSSWMNKAYSRRCNDFKRRILSLVYTNKKDMFLEEAYWQSFIKDRELRSRYYNLRRHGDNHWSSDDNKALSVREKQSIAKRGERNNMFGKHHTDATKKKMSANAKGFSENARQNAKKAVSERKKSLEEKQHMSAIMTGRRHSDSTKKKISAALLGKRKPKLTEERKRLISEANIGRQHSEEIRKKMSINSKGKHQNTVMATNISGENIRIPKDVFDACKNKDLETRDYVGAASLEARRRKALRST